MPELKVYLSTELDKKFRRIAMSVYGYGRGSLSKAAEEAFSRWCAEHEQATSVSAEPVTPVKTNESSEVSSHTGIDPEERKRHAAPANVPDDSEHSGPASSSA